MRQRVMQRKRSQWGQRRAAMVLLTGLSLIMAGCGGDDHANEHSGGSGSAPMAVPVTVVSAIQKTVQPSEEWTGRFEAPESVEIRARVAGILEHVNFHAGQKVHRGDVLFSIDAHPFEAELARATAQLSAARTQADLALSEARRSKKLLDTKATSQQEFDQLSAQQRNMEASVKAAEAAVQLAKLNVEYTTIRAPIDGRISRTMITSGNLISVGTPVLTTLVAVDPVYVYFAMSEQAYLKSVGVLRQKQSIHVSMGLTDEEGTPHQGLLDFVDNRVNPTTGTLQARAVFDNRDDRWIPGLFARIRVPEGAPISAVMVPDRAIGTDQSKKIVWVVGANNTAVQRDVMPGVLIDGLRVITSGLKPGEQVIVDGTQRVQPGMPVKPELLKTPAASESSTQPKA